MIALRSLLLAGSIALLPHATQAAEPIAIELNKLEDVASKCRTYLVIGSPGADAVQSLKADLIVFGKDGVIARRLIAELGPLRAKKTTVRIFDLEIACSAMSGLLLNDVTACAPASPEQCLERLAPTSRLPVRFFK